MEELLSLIGICIFSWMFGHEPNIEVKLYLGKYFNDKDIEETLNSLGEVPDDIRQKLTNMLNESVELYKKHKNHE